ncbi:MAG: hypothetical protein ABII82_03945 [Verrucomicrobiota bacterium]
MKPANQPWERLVAAARRAPDELAGDLVSPAGFATRVVALAGVSAQAAGTAPFERLALRALGCAVAVMMLSAVWSIAPTATAAAADDRALDLIDPVGEVLQLVQASR